MPRRVGWANSLIVRPPFADINGGCAPLIHPTRLSTVKRKILACQASAQPFKTAEAVLLQATNYLTVGGRVGWANSLIVRPPFADINGGCALLIHPTLNHFI
jgi:hypothetical protein